MLDGERIGLFSNLEETLALLFAIVAMAFFCPMWLAWPIRRGRLRPAFVETGPADDPRP